MIDDEASKAKLDRVISQDFVDSTATNLYVAYMECGVANCHI